MDELQSNARRPLRTLLVVASAVLIVTLARRWDDGDDGATLRLVGTPGIVIAVGTVVRVIPAPPGGGVPLRAAPFGNSVALARLEGGHPVRVIGPPVMAAKDLGRGIREALWWPVRDEATGLDGYILDAYLTE
jgi:hypothetical protein